MDLCKPRSKVIAMSDLSSEKLVSGNFGEEEEMGFSNRNSARDCADCDLMTLVSFYTRFHVLRGVAPAIFLPQFFAVYGSIAHACCACRAVERVAKLPQLRQFSTRLQEQPGLLRSASSFSSSRLAKLLDSGHWLRLRRCFKVLYSPILLLILVLLLQDPDFYPGAGDFFCFPCRCVYPEEGFLLCVGNADFMSQLDEVLADIILHKRDRCILGVEWTHV